MNADHLAKMQAAAAAKRTAEKAERDRLEADEGAWHKNLHERAYTDMLRLRAENEERLK